MKTISSRIDKQTHTMITLSPYSWREVIIEGITHLYEKKCERKQVITNKIKSNNRELKEIEQRIAKIKTDNEKLKEELKFLIKDFSKETKEYNNNIKLNKAIKKNNPLREL